MLALLFASVLQIGDMARIVDLEEPAITPNAARIAFVAISQDLAHAAYVNRLYVVEARTGRTTALVTGPDAAVPRWSPDGARLAYLAESGGIRQLFVRSSDGKSVKLTHSAGDVIDEAWSPNGRELAYVAADPQKPSTFFFAGDNDYTQTALTPPDHLWVLPSSGGKARRLTSGSWTIAPTDPGGIFSPHVAWTRDGRAIAYTRIENTFSGDSEYSTLWQIDVATRAARKLTNHSAFELSPAYAPDGAHLVYWYPLNGDFNSETTLRVVGNDAERQLRRVARSQHRGLALVSRRTAPVDLRNRSHAELLMEGRPRRDR